MKGMSISSIDYLKFIFSLFVVSIHTRFASDISNPVGRDVWVFFSDCAVPFFFSVSGYFIYNTVIKKDIPKLNYQIKKVGLLYIIWSLLYLPVNIYGEVVKYGNHSTWHINIIKGWIFTGDNYGSWILWYLLAFLVALIIIRLLVNVVSINGIIIISFLLFAIGWAYSSFHESFQLYIYDHTFRTTRNGFFLGLACLCSGFLVARYTPKNLVLLVVSLILLFYCGKYLRLLLGGCILLSIALRIDINNDYSIWLRQCSILIFFIHMFFVFLFKDILGIGYGTKLFGLTACASFIISLIIVITSTKVKRLSFLRYLT